MRALNSDTPSAESLNRIWRFQVIQSTRRLRNDETHFSSFRIVQKRSESLKLSETVQKLFKFFFSSFDLRQIYSNPDDDNWSTFAQYHPVDTIESKPPNGSHRVETSSKTVRHTSPPFESLKFSGVATALTVNQVRQTKYLLNICRILSWCYYALKLHRLAIRHFVILDNIHHLANVGSEPNRNGTVWVARRQFY